MDSNLWQAAGALQTLQTFIITIHKSVLVDFATLNQRISGSIVWSADHGLYFRNKILNVRINLTKI